MYTSSTIKNYHFKCGGCESIHPAEEWNAHTISNLGGTEVFSDWLDDNTTFMPIERSLADDIKAWFNCPSCDKEAYILKLGEIQPVLIGLKTNVESKFLLDEGW